MGMGRYVVDTLILERRSAREVAAAHGTSSGSWLTSSTG